MKEPRCTGRCGAKADEGERIYSASNTLTFTQDILRLHRLALLHQLIRRLDQVLKGPAGKTKEQGGRAWRTHAVGLRLKMGKVPCRRGATCGGASQIATIAPPTAHHKGSMAPTGRCHAVASLFLKMAPNSTPAVPFNLSCGPPKLSPLSPPQPQPQPHHPSRHTPHPHPHATTHSPFPLTCGCARSPPHPTPPPPPPGPQPHPRQRPSPRH